VLLTLSLNRLDELNEYSVGHRRARRSHRSQCDKPGSTSPEFQLAKPRSVKRIVVAGNLSQSICAVPCKPTSKVSKSEFVVLSASTPSSGGEKVHQSDAPPSTPA
jgi:hypothetical protein